MRTQPLTLSLILLTGTLSAAGLASQQQEAPQVELVETPSIAQTIPIAQADKADQTTSTTHTASTIPPPYVDAKFGYFFFLSSEMQDIYDEGGFDFQLSGAYPVYHYLAFYSSFEFQQRSGHSKISGSNTNGDATSIWQIPLSAGLQFNIALDSKEIARTYITLGPRYVFAHTTNDSDFVPKTMSANGFGGFANFGFLVNVYRGMTIDLFGEYSYVRLKFESSKRGTTGNTVQTGGLAFGIGIGYSF